MMKKLIFMALVIMAGAAFSPACAQGKKKSKKTAKAVKLLTQSDSISYVTGMDMTKGLEGFLKQMKVDSAYMGEVVRGFEETIDKGDSPAQVAYNAGVIVAESIFNRMSMIKEDLKDVVVFNDELMLRGFSDALRKDSTLFTQNAADTYSKEMNKMLKEKKTAAAIAEGEKFLAENAQKEGVVTLLSGLQYKILRKGEGAVAKVTDEVEVKYEGRLIDGTVFDSSYKRNPQTSKFRPNQVIKGWTEALTMMPEGSMWEIYIPQNLAYGERQAGKIPPCSTLIFTVEVEKVIPQLAPVQKMDTIVSPKPASKSGK